MLIIDSDITKAQTLPSRFYYESSTFEEVQSTFGEYWHFVAHRSQLSTATPVDNPLREPMVITQSDRIRCVSNVCTHRGMLVCTKSSEEKRLQCAYHGRTFGLDGAFRNMPEFQDVKEFPTDADNLVEFPLSEWKGLLFNTIYGSNFDGFISVKAEIDDFFPCNLNNVPI